MPICSRTYEIQGDGVSIKKNEINYFSDLKRVLPILKIKITIISIIFSISIIGKRL